MKNKYDEALDRIAFNYGLSVLDDETNDILDAKFNNDVKVIMSLIKKETPMKPIKTIRNRHEWSEDIINLYEAITCGKCFYELQEERTFNFCHQCGQKIDWGDENE